MLVTSWEILEWLSFAINLFNSYQLIQVAFVYNVTSPLHWLINMNNTWPLLNVIIYICNYSCLCMFSSLSFRHSRSDFPMMIIIGIILSSSTVMLSLINHIFVNVPLHNRFVLSCRHLWPYGCNRQIILINSLMLSAVALMIHLLD